MNLYEVVVATRSAPGCVPVEARLMVAAQTGEDAGRFAVKKTIERMATTGVAAWVEQLTPISHVDLLAVGD